MSPGLADSVAESSRPKVEVNDSDFVFLKDPKDLAEGLAGGPASERPVGLGDATQSSFRPSLNSFKNPKSAVSC